MKPLLKNKNSMAIRTSALSLLITVWMFFSVIQSAIATDVPNGGTYINVPTGSTQMTVSLTNKTRKNAKDVRVVIECSNPPNINELNRTDIAGDYFDDNLNAINDYNNGEDNTTDDDDSLSSIARTIFEGHELAIGDSFELEITFDSFTPSGCSLLVLFSQKGANNKHNDICAAVNLDGLNPQYASLPIGSFLSGVGAVNNTDSLMTELYVYSPVGNPFVSAVVDSPYHDSNIQVFGSYIALDLIPDVPEGDTVDVNVQLTDFTDDPTAAVGMHTMLIFIPTLSEWGMLILALLLLAAGMVAVVRRRKTALNAVE